ncbi:DUF5958 family protein [Streptomyces diastatochromogenes]|uniref:DUF5958 family protein n=1 Tax=Streptomyces diastatochromogenes TaxID=42236 RepID=UPI0036A68FD7
MNERAVILNGLAQGLRPLSQGLAWFEGLADEEQAVALRDLCQFCVQARAACWYRAWGLRMRGGASGLASTGAVMSGISWHEARSPERRLPDDL